LDSSLAVALHVILGLLAKNVVVSCAAVIAVFLSST
jgi:hypothetical protein